MESGAWHVVLNCGDIESTQNKLKEGAAELGVKTEIVDTWERVSQLWTTDEEELPCPLTLICCTDKTEAVSATDVLACLCDMAAWKPGELAFYPCPKLLIRRGRRAEGGAPAPAMAASTAASSLCPLEALPLRPDGERGRWPSSRPLARDPSPHVPRPQARRGARGRLRGARG